MLTSAVVRPVAVGAAATAVGCLVSAAPLPAGAAFVGYLGAALLVMLGWVRHHRDRRSFGLANTVTLARLVLRSRCLAATRQRETVTSSRRNVVGVPSSSVLVHARVTVRPRYGVRSTACSRYDGPLWAAV
jgi:hypothetical protein